MLHLSSVSEGSYFSENIRADLNTSFTCLVKYFFVYESEPVCDPLHTHHTNTAAQHTIYTHNTPQTHYTNTAAQHTIHTQHTTDALHQHGSETHHTTHHRRTIQTHQRNSPRTQHTTHANTYLRITFTANIILFFVSA